MKLTRRKFIAGLFALIATIIGGTILIIPFHEVVAGILKDQLSYLRIQDGAVEKFALEISDSAYYEKKSFGWKKQWFVRVYDFFDNPWIRIPGRERHMQYCTFFVSDFLLSTDFFINRMDESKPVNYIALYEPYKRPCSNPFSNLYYPAA